MPSSSAKAAEATSYDAVRANPFTRIHGRPTRQDYELLKKEASDLASEVDNITFEWSRDIATGEEYGLLAEIIGDVEYNHLTNLIWAQEQAITLEVQDRVLKKPEMSFAMAPRARNGHEVGG